MFTLRSVLLGPRISLHNPAFFFFFFFSAHAHVCLTRDGVMGEGLDVGQVVVRTVFFKPLAHVLLSPQHHRFGQTGQSGTGVVNGEGFAWTQLEHRRRTDTCSVNSSLPTSAAVFSCEIPQSYETTQVGTLLLYCSIQSPVGSVLFLMRNVYFLIEISLM